MAPLTDRLARRTTTGRYIPEADGLRFVAIMLVLLFLAGFFYLHTFVFRSVNPVNGALWSLEVEIIFYLLLPHIARVFSLSARPRRVILLGAIAVAEPLQRHFASPVQHFSLVGLFQF